MKLTKAQKKAMRELTLCKVIRRKMWRSSKQLGYTSPSADRRRYDINIANDTGSRDVEDVVLLHEIGHCYFGHNDLDIKEELLLVKSMCDGEGIPFSTTLLYGGPMSFLNIAMDLEINSKLLTVGNIKTIKDFGFELCTPEGIGVEVGESYRSYYLPLLRRVKDMLNNSPKNNGGDDGKGDPQKGDSDKQKGGKSGNDTDSTQDKTGSAAPKNDTGDDLSNECPLTGIDEIDDALLKEGYIGGVTKAKDTSNKSDSSTVGDKQREIEKRDASGKSGKDIGNSNQTTGSIHTVAANTSEEIEKFLRSIVHSSQEFTQDSMRLWNRGTRDRASGVIYNSLKLAPQKKKKKLGILVDISGSMDISTIQAASQSLKDSSKFLDKGSKFVTWNTGLSQEFPITNIPDKINVGGGTDMVAGIQYLVENGFTDIVVYSDFETYGLETVKPEKYRLYSIVVGSSYVDDKGRVTDLKFEKFLNKNKKVLILK